MARKEFIEAGRIVNTHGIAGEVKTEVWLDSPSFMKGFKRFFIRGKEYAVNSSRMQKGFLLISLAGIDSINAAMALKGEIISIARSDAALPKGGCFVDELIGARAVDEQGREIGILEEVFESPASPVYVIRGDEEHLVPGIPEFIISKDADAGLITVRLIDGM